MQRSHRTSNDRPIEPPSSESSPAVLTRNAGAILLAVVLITTFVLSVTAGLVQTSLSASRVQSGQEEDIKCYYLTQAGLHTAIAEINSGLDPTGFGLGAMGISVPVAYTDSQGDKVGEFKSILRPLGDDYELLVVSGVPDLANARVTMAARGLVTSAPAVKPVAVSCAGPLRGPDLRIFAGSTVDIDGGNRAAFYLSPGAYTNFMDELGSEVKKGRLTYDTTSGSDIRGGEQSTYEHATAGTLTGAIVEEEPSLLSATELNDYRVNLRAAALDMADSADLTITETVVGNQTWGTEASPQVTVIDTTVQSSRGVFKTIGQSITGHGTLIVKGRLRPSHMNLNWTGDVYVVNVGGTADGFELHGSNWTVDGNLIVLGDDAGEATLKASHSKSNIADWGPSGIPSSLTVNGNLLVLAEANAHEADVEVGEDNRGGDPGCDMTVNGILGLYGSRIEMDDNSDRDSITVNGSLVFGMAQDLDPTIARTDDFYLGVKGLLDVTYDETLTEAASALLGTLQEEQEIEGLHEHHQLAASVTEGNPHDVYDEMEAIIATESELNPYTTNFGVQ